MKQVLVVRLGWVFESVAAGLISYMRLGTGNYASEEGERRLHGRPKWLRYTIGIAGVVAFAGIRLAFDNVLGSHVPYAPFLAAVALATSFGGFGPGLVSLLLGLLAANYLFIEPRYTFSMAPLAQPTFTGSAAYCTFGLVICFAAEAVRRAALRAQNLSASFQQIQRHLNGVLTSITDGFLVIDAGYRFSYMNEPAKALFAERGVNPETLIGREIFIDAFPEASDQDWGSAFRRAMSERLMFEHESFCTTRRRWYRSRFYPSAADGGITILFHDVTERRQARQRLQIQHAVTSALAQADSLQQAAPEILKGVCLAANCDVAALWVLDSPAAKLRCIEAFSCGAEQTNVFTAASRECTLARGTGVPGRVWATRQPVWIPDVSKDPNFPRAAAAMEAGLHGAFAAPIHAGEEFYGAIEFFSTTVREPEESLLATVSALALQIGQFALRKRAEASLIDAQKLLKRHAADLEQAVSDRTLELRETIVELEGLSYSIIHDLRAPLRAMQNCAQLLAEDYGREMDDPGRDYIRRITTASRRMDLLIQDVLAYSRVMRKKLKLEPVDMDRLVRGMLESYPQLHKEKAEVEIEGTLPVVIAHEGALTQCISSLLDNAVKFVNPGVMPRVRIRAQDREPEATPGLPDGFVRLWFEDNGIGIERAYWDRIFHLFQRLNKDYPGNGVGLTVARKAAERMGGSAGIGASELGKGSRFWIALRRVEAPAEPARQAVMPLVV